MRVISWNVNGLRAVMQKNFASWLNTCGADVVGLQEVRATPEQLKAELAQFQADGWHVTVTAAERKGYSGVALLSRTPPDSLVTSVGVDDIDVEGRLQFARFGKLLIVNGYFPNGNGKERDNSRIPYKLDFYRKVFDVVDAERLAGGRILVMGDLNTAHKEIDLARPKDNAKTSGFRPEERAELDRWIAAGWVDTFRQFHDEGGRYSWWSARFGVREKNVGWRIDMVLASSAAAACVRDAFILSDVLGSDHAPIGVDLDDSVRS